MSAQTDESEVYTMPSSKVTPDATEPPAMDIAAEIDRLARNLEAYPQALPELIAALRHESDPNVVDYVAQAIAGNRLLLKDPEVLSGVVSLLEAHESTAVRTAGLTILASAPEVSSELSALVAGVAARDESPALRAAAIRTLSHWLDAGVAPHADRIGESLTCAMQFSSDAATRGTAIETIALHATKLENAAVRDALRAALTRDASPDNRAMAAVAMASMPASTSVVAAELGSAFTNEQDKHTRNLILIQLYRIGGRASLERLSRDGADTGTLAQEADTFLQEHGSDANGSASAAAIIGDPESRNPSASEFPSASTM